MTGFAVVTVNNIQQNRRQAQSITGAQNTMENTLIQKRKIGVAGSFQNQLMGNNDTIPVVGKGATILHYSDRTAYQVLEVSADNKTAIIEEMNATAAKAGLPMGHQEWILTPSGRKMRIRYRNGAWRQVTTVVKFEKEFIDSLPKPDSGIYCQLSPELREKIYDNNVRPVNVVKGVTRECKEYNKISIIFGIMEHHYDWEF